LLDAFDDSDGITTPMHPTVERLSTESLRMSAAGDGPRYVASVVGVAWLLYHFKKASDILFWGIVKNSLT